MSVVKSPCPRRPELGEKVVLPRRAPDLWTTLQREWAGEDAQRWRRLGMLHLYVYCHWTVEMIGRLFGHSKGHVSRILRQVTCELSERFVPELDEAAERLAGLEMDPDAAGGEPADD